MTRASAFAPVAVLLALLAGHGGAAQSARHRVIFDTDFALPPQDDGLALALALNSPELDIVGITTVAGNFNLARANADVLRMLEMTGLEVHEQMSRSGMHVPTIVLTADDAPEVKSRYTAAGVKAYLRKPVGGEELYSAIVHAVGLPERRN